MILSEQTSIMTIYYTFQRPSGKYFHTPLFLVVSIWTNIRCYCLGNISLGTKVKTCQKRKAKDKKCVESKIGSDFY